MSPAGTNWLEGLLKDTLRPAPAPDALWDKVWQPRETAAWRPEARPKETWAAWAFGAAAVAGLAMAAIVLPGNRADGPKVFRSADPGEMRAWVKNCTGLEVPFARELPAKVKLLEARATGGRAEILLKIDGRETVLKAAPAHAAATAHAHNTGTWTARGVAYEMEKPALAAEVCELCHAL